MYPALDRAVYKKDSPGLCHFAPSHLTWGAQALWRRASGHIRFGHEWGRIPPPCRPVFFAVRRASGGI